MTNKKTKKETVPDFEQALNELEAIVQQMEKDELSLEQALLQFETGVKLARQCQQALKTAEQRIEILSAQINLDDNHE